MIVGGVLTNPLTVTLVDQWWDTFPRGWKIFFHGREKKEKDGKGCSLRKIEVDQRREVHGGPIRPNLPEEITTDNFRELACINQCCWSYLERAKERESERARERERERERCIFERGRSSRVKGEKIGRTAGSIVSLDGN